MKYWAIWRWPKASYSVSSIVCSRQSVAGGLVAIESQASASCPPSAGRWRRRAAPARSAISRASSAPIGSARRGRNPAECIDTGCARRARRRARPVRTCRNNFAPSTLSSCGRQPRDDLIRGRRALVARLQCNEHASGVERVARAANGHGDMCDGRILEDDRAERHLMPHHFGEGDVLRRLGYAGDQPGILLRKETLWGSRRRDRPTERQSREENQQRDQAEFEHEVEAALIAFQQRRKTALAQSVEPPMMGVLRRDQRNARPSSASASATPTAETAIVIDSVTANSRNSRR